MRPVMTTEVNPSEPNKIIMTCSDRSNPPAIQFTFMQKDKTSTGIRLDTNDLITQTSGKFVYTVENSNNDPLIFYCLTQNAVQNSKYSVSYIFSGGSGGKTGNLFFQEKFVDFQNTANKIIRAGHLGIISTILLRHFFQKSKF